MTSKLLIAGHFATASLLFLTALLVACQASLPTPPISPTASPTGFPSAPASIASPQASSPSGSEPTFAKVQQIMTESCMPCHNRQSLPMVIERVKQASFTQISGQSRLRLLTELEQLKQLMEKGLPISFDSQEELHKFFDAEPGTLFLMVEKGVMPPAWSAELMQQINWPGYQALTIENRIELLKYAKSYTKQQQ